MNQNWKVRATTCFSILGIATLLAIPARSDDKSAATYKQKCVACHGADGKGDTPTGKALGVHSFASAETSKMSDQELADVIEKGKGKMPKYGSSMKPEEIKAMVAYIRTLGK
jgi:mono/diheme cytochrome c family protein